MNVSSDDQVNIDQASGALYVPPSTLVQDYFVCYNTIFNSLSLSFGAASGSAGTITPVFVMLIVYVVTSFFKPPPPPEVGSAGREEEEEGKKEEIVVVEEVEEEEEEKEEEEEAETSELQLGNGGFDSNDGFDYDDVFQYEEAEGGDVFQNIFCLGTTRNTTA